MADREPKVLHPNWMAAVMFGNRVLIATLAAQQAAHEKDCMADRERTRQSFEAMRSSQEEAERRLVDSMAKMHKENASRLGQIESFGWKVVSLLVITLLSVIGFGLAHILGKFF